MSLGDYEAPYPSIFRANSLGGSTHEMPSDASLKVQASDSVGSLESLRADWDRLLADFPHATTFSTLEWLLPWWRAFGRDDRLRVLSFSDPSSSLVGLAPLALIRHSVSGMSLRVLRLMGDGSGDSDNLDLPVRPGFEESFASALLAHLEKPEERWDFCELNTLPASSPAAAAIVHAAKQRGWPAFQYPRAASAITLPGNWEAYLQRLSAEDQKNLARYTRRLENRYQVQIYRCSQESEIPRCLEALFHLHQSRWNRAGEPGSFSSAARRRFYDELSLSLLARRWLEFWVLELDGMVAAAQFAFRYRDTVYQLQEGYDPDRSTDRVGVILRAHVMKQLISEGVRVYDFLGGEPGYKARWGAEPRFYTDLKFARPFSWGAAYLSALHQGGKSKEWLRKSLPEPVWSVLHKTNVCLRGGTRSGTQS